MDNKGKSNQEQLSELGIVTWERYQVIDPEEIEKLKKMDQSKLDKEQIQVEDESELEKIVTFKKNNNDKLPDGITSVMLERSNRTRFERYFYQDKFHYFKKKYLSNDDIEFELRVKNALSQQSIASSLFFFKGLAIAFLMLTAIGLLIGFSSM